MHLIEFTEKTLHYLKWKNKEYILNDPEFIDREVALNAFPAAFRTGLRIMGIQYYLSLSRRD
jgi:hypothetical protein